MNQLELDKQLIADLGGPMAVARKLGRADHEGRNWVQNWLTRGIPAEVRLEHGANLLRWQKKANKKAGK